MSHTIATHVQPCSGIACKPRERMLPVFVMHLRRKLVAWLAERALRRAEIELQDLDDRMLKDIGLGRSEIGSVLRDLSGERIHDIARHIDRHCSAKHS